MLGNSNLAYTVRDQLLVLNGNPRGLPSGYFIRGLVLIRGQDLHKAGGPELAR